MLKSLEQLQYGYTLARNVQASIELDRFMNLQVNKDMNIRTWHTTGLTCIDIDKAEERYIIAGSKNGSIGIYDVLNTTGNIPFLADLLCTIGNNHSYSHQRAISSIQWYPHDSGLFVTSGMDHKLKLWDTTLLRPVDSISLHFKINNHHMSNFEDNILIAVALDQPQVILVDPRIGSKSHELRGHRETVKCVQWSPLNPHILATGGSDNNIFLWDVRSARSYLRSMDRHNGQTGSKKDAHERSLNNIVFTEDGLYLVSLGHDKRLYLWDVYCGKNTLVNYGQVRFTYAGLPIGLDIWCGSSTPLLFVPADNRIAVYDLFSGCLVETLVAHYNLVTSCKLRPSFLELYSAGLDSTLVGWAPALDESIRNEKTSTLQDPLPVYDQWSDED